MVSGDGSPRRAGGAQEFSLIERDKPVSGGDQPVDLSAVLRRSTPRRAGGGQGESKLDSLLDQHSRSQEGAGPASKEASLPVTPLDRLRQLVEGELIPAFEELRRKYEGKGITLVLDASNFLRGGRDIKVVIEFAGTGLRFDGTVMPNSIAFQQTRFAKDDPAGLTASGPTLRTRSLTGDTFRDFVCDRIVGLVQAVTQRKS